VAVVDFLSGLRLDGSQRVLGALSITLAEGIEAAPLYAQAKIARELREILGELSEARGQRSEPEPARGAEAVSAERHMAKALAALDDVSLRELEAVAEKLTRRRRDGLRQFGLLFGAVASTRRGASFQSVSYHLETAIALVDDRLAERIEDAEAPFWQHVRAAVAEREKSAA
jgi:hypothetical protein